MIIDKDLILLDLTGDKETLSRPAGKVPGHERPLPGDQPGSSDIREKEYSAALGYEVAIPHEQSDTVKDPFVVFGRVKEPIL